MKGNTLFVLLLVIIPLVIVINYKSEGFDFDKVSTELENEMNRINNMIKNDDADFLKKNHLAVNTAEDILHNISKMNKLQKNIKKETVNYFYTIAAVVLLVIIVSILLMSSDDATNGLVYLFFGLLKQIIVLIKRNIKKIYEFLKKIINIDIFKRT